MSDETRQLKQERSLGELFAELVKELTTLVRQELNLAKTEMSQKAARVGMHVGFLAAGGAIAYAGLLAIIAGIIILLARMGLEWWISALLVGVVVAGAGAFLVMQGLNKLKNENLTPEQTIESLQSLKEDIGGTNRVRDRAAQ